MHDMIADEVLRLFEPEGAQLVQHGSFSRHGRLQHIVKSGNAVGYYNEYVLAQVVQFTNLALVQQRYVDQMSGGR